MKRRASTQEIHAIFQEKGILSYAPHNGMMKMIGEVCHVHGP